MRLPTVAFFLELPLHGQKQLCLSVSTGVSELPLDSIDQRSASIHAVFLGFTTRSLEHVWKKRGRKDGATQCITLFRSTWDHFGICKVRPWASRLPTSLG